MVGAGHFQRLTPGEQILELGGERDVVGDEVLDTGTERRDGRRGLVLDRQAEGRGLAIVEVGEADASSSG